MSTPPITSSSAGLALNTIKLVHTLVWAFFAACVVAIPIAAAYAEYSRAALLIGLVALEVLVLLFNSWRCPLTDEAARYTGERRANFDIYLPEWLARHNKTIFGTLYVAGVLFTLARWVRT
jgi:hypothetical protein